MSAKNIVQFVVIRGDLSKVQNWPSGAIIAQACHACVAVIHKHYSDPDTQAYLHDIENMHKIVLEVSLFSNRTQGAILLLLVIPKIIARIAGDFDSCQSKSVDL